MQQKIKPDTRVVVLGNHGLLVSGDTVAEAEQLLQLVARKLAGRLHQPMPADSQLTSLCDGLPYRAVDSDFVHALARDPKRMQAAMRGSLYPDHVIFLGHRMAAANAHQPVQEAVRRAVSEHGVEPVLLLQESGGALIHEQASAAQQALVQCLGDVLARVDLDAELNYLNTNQVDELLNWDAEKYRQSLDSAC